jgi:ribosomal protein S6--L-glutamate ligase
MGVPMLLGRASLGAQFLVHPTKPNILCPETQTAMKIALLTRNPKLYSHQRLIETAEKRGHQMVPIDYLKCYMNITSKKPELRYLGEKLEGFDAVIPRIGASHTFYGMAVLRQFEMMGVYPVNESVAIGRSRDKLRSLQLLARDGVGLPVTAFAHDSKRTDDLLGIVGGAPVVIKLLEGTQGIGVVLSETHKSAKSVVEAFHGANVAILVQEFIKEAEGRDIRAFVVGADICWPPWSARVPRTISAPICIVAAPPA